MSVGFVESKISKQREISMKSCKEAMARGVDLLHDPRLNKGTSFTEVERDVFRLRGLLPPRVNSQAEQVARALESLRRKDSDLERYIFMIALQDRDETLFYRLILDNLEEMVPIIYTPTVGRACQEYGHIFRRPRGLYISAEDNGHVAEILFNWPGTDVRVIVVLSETDLEEGRIYPPLARIREVSLKIAAAVAAIAYDQGLEATPKPADLASFIRAQVFEPSYRNYL